jgi:hypothetical protein
MKKPLFNDDEEFYINESGLFVLTAEYLLKRGYCCGNGCLHCPFDYKNVVDPIKQKRLLDARIAHQAKSTDSSSDA